MKHSLVNHIKTYKGICVSLPLLSIKLRKIKAKFKGLNLVAKRKRKQASEIGLKKQCSTKDYLIFEMRDAYNSILNCRLSEYKFKAR